MSFDTAIVNRTSLTSVTTDDYTATGFGIADATLWFASYPTVIDTVSSDAGLGIGASDGTREFMNVTSRADGKATTDANRSNASDKVIRTLTLISRTNGSIVGSRS